MAAFSTTAFERAGRSCVEPGPGACGVMSQTLMNGSCHLNGSCHSGRSNAYVESPLAYRSHESIATAPHVVNAWPQGAAVALRACMWTSCTRPETGMSAPFTAPYELVDGPIPVHLGACREVRKSLRFAVFFANVHLVPAIPRGLERQPWSVVCNTRAAFRCLSHVARQRAAMGGMDWSSNQQVTKRWRDSI